MKAMTMGTIPIASRAGGIPEIVQGRMPKKKMLFESGNVEEFVDNMEPSLTLSTEQIENIDLGSPRNHVKKLIGKE
jgi:glycogen synthase